MDEHVPVAKTMGLRESGVAVLTIQEDGFSGLSDEEVLEPAKQLGRMLFTQDADFLAYAANFSRRNVDFSRIVFAHQLTASIGQCVRDLELIAKACELEEIANRIEFLPLK